MYENPFNKLKVEAVSSVIPKSATIVSPNAVISPQGNMGALVKYPTGIYAIICGGSQMSCPQDWAETIEFAESLKSARKALGLSQRAFAELFEIPRRTVESWETATKPAPKYLRKLLLEKLHTMIESQEK